MSSENTSTSKLVAILFADIQGYTSLMQKNQSEAATMLRRFQSELNATVEKFSGRIVNFYGDGALSVFETPNDAVRCAMQLNSKFRTGTPIPVRLGVHSGPVVFEGEKVFGNSVNIASRIESMGIPGSVLLSDRVRQDIKNQPDISIKNLGSFEFKNVEEPMAVYALANEGFIIPNLKDIEGKLEKHNKGSLYSNSIIKYLLGIIIIAAGLFLYNQLSNSTSESNEDGVKKLALSNISKKSIAVLPLKNMSGQENLEYVCDGMTDAIISRLTMIGDMDKVSSMTSVLKYKNPAKGLVQIASELQVANILQGSFQKSGEQIRITLQLIDGSSDNQLWEHTYTGEWKPDDIFNIQATVTENVAEKMNTQITASEFESIQKMPTTSEEAYSLFLLAEHERYKLTEESFTKAIPLYQEAISLDSAFVEAYIGQSWIWETGGLVWGIYNEHEAWSNSKYLLDKALAIDPENQEFKSILFSGSFYYDWNFDLAEEYFRDYMWRIGNETLDTYMDYALKTGRYDKSYEEARKRSLANPTQGVLRAFEAQALMFLAREEEAIQVLSEADKYHKDDPFYLRESIRHYFYLKEYEKSQSNLALFLESFPDRLSIIIWWQIIYGTINNQDSIVQENLKILHDRVEAGTSGSPAWFLSLYYFYIDDVEKGFEWLEKSFENHEVEMTWLREEPLLKEYRSDPRYRSIYQKMGWPIDIKG